MPRTRGSRRVEEARRLYAAGMTTREIGVRLAADPRTIARWLGEACRRRGPRGRADVENALILAMRDRDGMSWTEIASALRMSRTGVRMRYLAATGQPRPERARDNSRP